jgi:putative selenate reductase
LKESRISESLSGKASDPVDLQQRKARRLYGAGLPEIDFGERTGFDLVIHTLDEATAQIEAGRCLQCDELCSICVTVCPNRANIEFTIEPVEFKVQQAQRAGDGIEISDLETVRIAQKYQILNIGDFCNECGNCATFCPTSGAPYRDKAKFHLTQESFDASPLGYYFSADNRLVYKHDGHSASLEMTTGGFIYESDDVKVWLGKGYAAQNAQLKGDGKTALNLRHAAEMAILFQAARQVLPLALSMDR